jgi:hypothetical protein
VKVRVTRTVLHGGNNCAGRDVFKGEEFYQFTGPTYGCISENGIALSTRENWWESFFFEFPRDAVEIINDKCDPEQPEVPA